MEFSPAVLREAEDIPQQVSPAMRKNRRDLRDLPTVTIDGEKARDFDDAISIEKIKTGYRLWVHIADVANYVREGSFLDEDAYQRGTSVYFPDRVIPMLPEALSNGICSLNPNVDRLTLTCEMDVSPQGDILRYDIYESIINSNERMTYTAVREILVDRDPAQRKRYAALLSEFELMEELMEILRAKRSKRGSIDFDLPEPEIVLDLQGRMTDIIRAERNMAHQIIEEFMLAANETVAGHIEEQGSALRLPHPRRARRGKAGGPRRLPRHPRHQPARGEKDQTPAPAEGPRQGQGHSRGDPDQHGPAPDHETGPVLARERRTLRPRCRDLHALHLPDPPLSGPDRPPDPESGHQGQTRGRGLYREACRDPARSGHHTARSASERPWRRSAT